MKNKIKYIFMLTVMLVAGSMQSEAFDFEVDGIRYEVTSLKDFTCGVVAGGKKYEGDIVIPSQVEYNNRHLKVKEIRSRAFLGCLSLTSIEIPNSVTTIGDYAFSLCISLTSIEIPNSVTTIGDDAFSHCSMLTSIEIPNSVTTIGDDAFGECVRLSSIKIPNSVIEIGDYAFYGCQSLTSIELPNSVKVIGKSGFDTCTSLTTVTLPNSVTKIGSEAFSRCTSLTSIEIPNSVKWIDNGTFSECSSLTSVEIPNSISEIREKSFSDCKSLTSISLPNSVSCIEKYAFSNCTALKDVQLNEGLESIQGFAFGNCQSLQSITIPGSLTSISMDGNPFWNCNSLKEMNFLYGPDYRCDGSKWEKWEDFAETFLHLEKIFIDRKFVVYDDEQYKLKEVDIKLRKIRELYLGEHYEALKIRNIAECENLEKIRCYTKLPPVYYSFNDFSKQQYMNVIVEVPYEALETYRSDPKWGNFWNLQGFEPTGVDDLETEEPEKSIIGRFDLNGNPVDEGYKGIAVIRFSDGSTKKVIL